MEKYYFAFAGAWTATRGRAHVPEAAFGGEAAVPYLSNT